MHTNTNHYSARVRFTFNFIVDQHFFTQTPRVVPDRHRAVTSGILFYCCSGRENNGE